MEASGKPKILGELRAESEGLDTLAKKEPDAVICGRLRPSDWASPSNFSAQFLVTFP